MATPIRIAKQLISGEVIRTDSISHDEGLTAQYWANLVELILDELPPATLPRICDLVIDYMVGEDD